MSLHWKRINPWPYPEGDGHFHKNEENCRHSPWLSSVCLKVQTFREETQERISTLLPMLLERKRGWCRHCWTVQTSCEDCQIQRAWAPAICQQGVSVNGSEVLSNSELYSYQLILSMTITSPCFAWFLWALPSRVGHYWHLTHLTTCNLRITVETTLFSILLIHMPVGLTCLPHVFNL